MLDTLTDLSAPACSARGVITSGAAAACAYSLSRCPRRSCPAIIVFDLLVREMFSLESNQMVKGSVCIGLRASCRVCARPAKWRQLETYSRTIQKLDVAIS